MKEEAKTKVHEKLIVERDALVDRDAHLRKRLKSKDNKKLRARTCAANNFCGISKVHIRKGTLLLPTMITDYMTKPLHVAKFDGFHQQIVHLPIAAHLMMAAVLN